MCFNELKIIHQDVLGRCVESSGVYKSKVSFFTRIVHSIFFNSLFMLMSMSRKLTYSLNSSHSQFRLDIVLTVFLNYSNMLSYSLCFFQITTMSSVHLLKSSIPFLHFGLNDNISTVENVKISQSHVRLLPIDSPSFFL